MDAILTYIILIITAILTVRGLVYLLKKGYLLVFLGLFSFAFGALIITGYIIYTPAQDKQTLFFLPLFGLLFVIIGIRLFYVSQKEKP
jgi:hypothetical protein